MLRLMIVDDEEIIRNAVASLIDYESIGYELVATAASGIEAYNIICDEYLDVVITDIRMPGLNGLELVEKAIKTDQNLNFIILSGYGEFEYAKQAMKFGVNHYILKPTDKNQLIEALMDIRRKREEQRESYLTERKKILESLHYPAERAFLIEGLQTRRLRNLADRYQDVLLLPEGRCSAILCYFLEEEKRICFANEMGHFLERVGARQFFSAIAVTGSMIFLTAFFGMAVQERIREKIREWSEEHEGPEISVAFLEEKTPEFLLEKVFDKISRYKEIDLIAHDGMRCRIQNKIDSDRHMEKLQEALESGHDISEMIGSALLQNGLGIHEMRNVALDIYMHFNGLESSGTIEDACDFFRKLCGCSGGNEIREQLCAVLKKSDRINEKRNNIHILKEYVRTHLDSETLSLKWLAQNYLFVNVQYLSRQFIKEEGERFSDYLTRQRMEEAKRLMHIYREDQIKDIAAAVGFGNNPKYFGQVFKKYTGYLPSDYMGREKE